MNFYGYQEPRDKMLWLKVFEKRQDNKKTVGSSRQKINQNGWLRVERKAQRCGGGHRRSQRHWQSRHGEKRDNRKVIDGSKDSSLIVGIGMPERTCRAWFLVAFFLGLLSAWCYRTGTWWYGDSLMWVGKCTTDGFLRGVEERPKTSGVGLKPEPADVLLLSQIF